MPMPISGFEPARWVGVIDREVGHDTPSPVSVEIGEPGLLVIEEPVGVTFESFKTPPPARRVLFLWQDLRARPAGNGTDALRLVPRQRRGDPQRSFIVRDTGALAHVRALHQVEEIGRGRLIGRLLLVTIGFITAVTMLVHGGVGLATAMVMRLLPRAAEERIGESALVRTFDVSRPITDDHVLSVLEKCSQVLANVFPETTGYTIVVVEGDHHNTFALPGGYIVIYQGMLEWLADEQELFGLLSHEAAHVELRHGMRRIVRESIVTMVPLVLFAGTGAATNYMAASGASFTTLAYDREEEMAADRLATEALAAAQLDPDGLVSLLSRLRSIEGSDPARSDFLSTHPALDTRIAAIEKAMLRSNRVNLLSPEEWQVLRLAAHMKGEDPAPDQ